MAYPDNIRAISIQQPWADEICLGQKPEEFRTWQSNWEGLTLIHASGIQQPAIIGFAFKERECKCYGPNDFGHLLLAPARLLTPILTPGALNYWRPQRNRPRQVPAFQAAYEAILNSEWESVTPEFVEYMLVETGHWAELPASEPEEPRHFIAGPTGPAQLILESAT